MTDCSLTSNGFCYLFLCLSTCTNITFCYHFAQKKGVKPWRRAWQPGVLFYEHSVYDLGFKWGCVNVDVF